MVSRSTRAMATIQLYADVVQPAGIGLRPLSWNTSASGSKLTACSIRRESGHCQNAPDNRRRHVARRRGLARHPERPSPPLPLRGVILAPATVQGDAAPEAIANALYELQDIGRVEVIILARGGGSAEDLAAFNDEYVARAVFACRVPVVTGVGHETDWTIVDWVADLRAPTPSAAAELCVPDVAEIRLPR